MRQERIELPTLGLIDLRAANCATAACACIAGTRGVRCLAALGVLLHWVWYRDPAVLANRLRGLAFGTLDSDSSDRGSNPRGVLL